ncbi:MAG: MBL fold metallo-hydrolase [Actinobacteria bacterium]|nr:MBL fold metallo-hydrolase [Actinomycetota bacterium]
MRAVAIHPDALAVTSRLWQTNAVAIRHGDEAVLIDSPYFPDELELLPALLSEAGFVPVGLLATHADFDHLLGRLAFPRLALGVGQSTADRLRARPGVAQRELRSADEEHYVLRATPLSLGAFQELPAPGKLEVGDTELELIPCEGHTSDGTAFFDGLANALVCGDYLSDVEIPLIGQGGSLTGYRRSLERLHPAIERAVAVIPGHGAVHDRPTARRILEEDLAYLDELERGDPRSRLPRGRDSARQRSIHEQNLRVIGAR